MCIKTGYWEMGKQKKVSARRLVHYSGYEELFSPIAFFSGQGRDRLLGWSFPFGELYSKK